MKFTKTASLMHRPIRNFNIPQVGGQCTLCVVPHFPSGVVEGAKRECARENQPTRERRDASANFNFILRSAV